MKSLKYLFFESELFIICTQGYVENIFLQNTNSVFYFHFPEPEDQYPWFLGYTEI